ncbi:hypothetical protein BABINDRAFT_141479 [Babjeviella inositovora NRRL Y-12698]|uniref:Uncharacterized protein n=1 Tax=Babjeviella inositovora NRRL Y-12698 TaxID=984486 RepID=A0A1E3QNW7_9ASCO|nr:uncharacterized protein BABINDRAFT_141479 [Babjeviella inositovora NRRL Y-12698]ODQ79340.1 hypothetical protein BABINDRAFT_141479 [Babjeviella inositovora NRRL Y-12698]
MNGKAGSQSVITKTCNLNTCLTRVSVTEFRYKMDHVDQYTVHASSPNLSGGRIEGLVAPVMRVNLEKTRTHSFSLDHPYCTIVNANLRYRYYH